MLEDVRHSASLGDRRVETIGEALALEKDMTLGKPKLKEKTRTYYRHLFAKIEDSIPGHKSAATWSAEDARKWWSIHCAANTAPLHANNALAVVRRAMGLLVERGIRRDDPTKGIKRLRIQKTRIDDLPSLEQMDAVIASTTSQPRLWGQEHCRHFQRNSGLGFQA
jgi:site-specific recombinase XerD